MQQHCAEIESVIPCSLMQISRQKQRTLQKDQWPHFPSQQYLRRPHQMPRLLRLHHRSHSPLHHVVDARLFYCYHVTVKMPVPTSNAQSNTITYG